MRWLPTLILLPLASLAQPFTVNDIAFPGQRGPLITDWALRVVANGGAMPSQNTIGAMETFRIANNDLTNNIVAMCCFVPDSLIACLTPLTVGPGYAMWTNSNFDATNLTVNGLAGNGSTKYIQTGVLGDASPMSQNSAGISVLMWTNPDIAGNGIVALQAGAGHQFSLFSFGGTGLFRCWSFLGSQNFVTGSVGTTTNGWLSGNRTAANAMALYKARSDTTFTTVATETGTQTGSITGTHRIPVFALNNAGTIGNYNAVTLSFVAIHSGLTLTQSSNLYTRVVTLRTALGGGSP